MIRSAPFMVLLLATGCGSDAAPAVAEGEVHVPCALAGEKELTPKCAVETVQQGERRLLVVRHPDGGFRRFAVSADGRDLAVVDGADQAALQLAGNAIEVRVDADLYRFALPLGGNARP